jgi:ubiquinone/menaquinone biosynthesis C-methylase UbiE
MNTQSSERQQRVREAYGEIARTRTSGNAAACCDQDLAVSDYSPEEIASVPDGAFLGEGSGNPVRAADLRPGETVVDLGCGAGMDVFLAANRVGKTGRVLGFDMTPEMLERARRNQSGGGYPQVEFHQAEIENLPVPAGSADVVISNCVINLTVDKSTVYREIFRILKPGGRFSISDIVLRGDAGKMRELLDQLPACNCVAQALEESRYLESIRGAGFEEVAVAAGRSAMAQVQAQEFIEKLRDDPTLLGPTASVVLAKGDPKDWGFSAEAVTLVGRKPLGA